MAEVQVKSPVEESSIVEMTATIPGDTTTDIRERMLAHRIADLAESLLRHPGTNPRGLLITVTSDPPTPTEPRPDLQVVASAPTYA